MEPEQINVKIDELAFGQEGKHSPDPEQVVVESIRILQVDIRLVFREATIWLKANTYSRSKAFQDHQRRFG